MIDPEKCFVLDVDLVTSDTQAWIRFKFKDVDGNVYYQHVRFTGEPFIGLVCKTKPAEMLGLTVTNMAALAAGH